MAIKKEYYYPSTDGRNNVHAIQWEPEDKDIVGVVQISHGMIEYINRYDEFARFLCSKGYVVVGNDHLGHGLTAKTEADKGYFADKSGFAYVVEDIHTLRTNTQKEYPNVPYHLLGHSMGSFVARIYLSKYAKGLTSAIIMGTAVMAPPILAVGTTITSSIIKKNGRRFRSPKVDGLAIGAYGKKFKNENSKNAWLSRDRVEVALYDADPMMQFMFTVGAYEDMFRGLKYLNDESNVRKIPAELPILLIAGENDPVGNFSKSVKKLYKSYKKCGLYKTKIRLYPEARHELLHELNKEDVFNDLYKWLRITQKEANN